LRDFLCYNPDKLLHRPFNMAIVDEADSILIDEGRAPLLIAEQRQNEDDRLAMVAALVRDLQSDDDYHCDTKQCLVSLTERGISRIEAKLDIANLYISQNAELLALINNALHARALLRRDIDYILQDGRVELVDEFTGRVVANRYLPNGLQEALEAREGLKQQQGGKAEFGRERVLTLGGLYVIGTNRFECSRIDDQLRGRAGRQGDSGTSRFFTSLEDELLIRFRVAEKIPSKYHGWDREAPLTDPEVHWGVNRIRRVIAAQNGEIRKILWQYAWIVEQQRQVIHRWRQAILLGRESPEFLQKELAGRYRESGISIAAETLQQIAGEILLNQIDRCWADFLERVADIRETIHLEQLRGKAPLAEFYRVVSLEGRDLRSRMEAAAAELVRRLIITPQGVDLEQGGIKRPAATWTYLINDMPFERTLKLGLGERGRKKP
jgi:preprotein translocase subunit SecA